MGRETHHSGLRNNHCHQFNPAPHCLCCGAFFFAYDFVGLLPIRYLGRYLNPMETLEIKE